MKPKPQIQFAVWKGRNEHRGKEAPRTAGARSVVVISDVSPTAPSFPLRGKRWGGRKGALGDGLVRSASDFRQEPMFQAPFHTIVTLRVSYYAPPDTGVSNLILVALEYLPAIEGVDGILMDGTFLRGRRGIDPWDRDGNSFSL